MRRSVLWGVLVTWVLSAPASVHAHTYFGFQIGISNAPPPPAVVFHDEPDFVYVRGAGVYVVRSRYDYDIFRHGRYYYVCDDGYWYRARSHRGPFRVVDVRYVPRSVFNVPERHWKHHWRHARHERWKDYRAHDRRYRHDHERRHEDRD